MSEHNDRLFEKMEDRIEELEAWKAEATTVIAKWELVAEPVVKGNAKYLGWYKWDAVAVELNRLTARIEELSGRTIDVAPSYLGLEALDE